MMKMLVLLLPIATATVAQAPALSLSANTKSVIPSSSQQEADVSEDSARWSRRR
ncbi:hypothetical protein PAHAL_5G373800 [Panicum hallii]|uniref:Uncharacterized protein n=1 Tax=Panicum hallii TaxID=206008 RepID=A0A2T8IMG2_9POAL|nr:hypothetical protein PAHAL_5G373800 [Panicum hallii]